MAEPIVGMKYGTYDTLSVQNEKYYRKRLCYSREISYGEHRITETFDHWVDRNDMKKQVEGCKLVDRMDINNPYNEAKLEVLYKIESGELIKMKHYGDKRTEDGDIIFNTIYGEKSCAVDHNENGVVDEGEITSYDVAI